jgi:hypothetical protein
MNKDIMRSAGFAKEVEMVEDGYCPDCGEKVDPTEFQDELSVKEFHISGLCQGCQDEIFGGSKKKPAKKAPLPVVGDDDFIIQGSLFNRNHWGGPQPDMLFNKHTGKSGSIWYVGDCEEKGAHVFCSTRDKSGFGGGEIKFPLKDGAVDSIKGPWHSSCDSLFDDTGIDVRDKHFTMGIISKGRGFTGNPYHYTIMKDVLYRDDKPILGDFHRVTLLAMEISKKMDASVYCYNESRGGIIMRIDTSRPSKCLW